MNPTSLGQKSNNKLLKILDESNIENIIKKLTTLYKNYCLNYLNDEQIIAEFPQLSHESQHLLTSAIKSNKSKILEAQITALCDPNVRTMKHFDWDIVQTLSGSNLDGQQRVLMNLALKTTDDETLHFELTREKLGKLIELLEENKN